MKKALQLTVLCLIYFPFFSFSNIVGIDKAALVAKNLSWVYHTGTVDFASIKPVLLSSRFEEGRAIYYIFGYSGQQGFAIVSAADNVLPILGYSFEGNYALKEEEMPPQMVSMFDFYARQISEAIINSMPPDQQINEQWEYFLKTVPNPEANPATIVGPLTATTWDQNCYYNELCPATGGTHPAGPCSHVYTGCVATAMAQIMKYHNYPPQGTGTLSYSEPGNSATASASADPSYGTLSVNLGYEYDWNNMPNSISASNTDIAALMKHCGYSVSMDYSYAGSSSYTSDVPSALVNNFYYSSTAAYLLKSAYTSTGWNALLKAEIDAARVSQYRGDGPNGGHSWVMDGYNDNYGGSGNIWFHFNWGWSGSNNGYFQTSNLNPGPYTFNNGCAAIFGITPKPVNLTYDAAYHSLVVSGNFATINARVKNTGTGLAGRSSLGYYASSNNFISSTDYLLGYDAVPILTASNYNSESIIVDLTAVSPTIPPGSYYIGYLADRNNDVPESNESDNNYAFASTVTVNCASAVINATDGTYYDKVNITWNTPDYVTYFKVYRSTINSSATAVAITGWQTADYYIDYSVIPDITYYYWVKCATTSLGAYASDFSSSNSGYAVLQSMTEETEYTINTDPRYFKFSSPYFYWCAVGVRNNVVGEDWDIAMFDNENMTTLLATSSSNADIVDFVVMDGNHAVGSTFRGIKAHRYSGSGSANIEFEGNNEMLSAGNNGSYNWAAGEVVEMYDVYLTPGYYGISLIHNSGTSNLDIGIFGSASGDYYQSRSDMIASSTLSGTNDEILYVHVGVADYYGVLVWANDANTANYNIKVETAGTWTGAVNTDWHNTGNWSAKYIPVAGMDVVIPSGVPNFPKISNDSATCNKLTINPGASLDISGKLLRVNDSLLVSGYLNLSSTTSDLYVLKSIEWESGSTANVVGSGEMYIYGNWIFMSGSNVQLNSGYVEFRGTGASYVRSFEANSMLYHIRNTKEIEFGISAMSTAPLTIQGNVYNYSGKLFSSYSGSDLHMKGSIQNLGGDFQFNDASLIIDGIPALSLKPGYNSYLNDLTLNTSGTLTLGGDYSDSLVINGDILIQQGTLSPGTNTICIKGYWTNQISPAGFTMGTSTVIFNGGNFHQYCSNESFNKLVVNKAAGGAFRVNGTTVTCSSYDWTAGAVDVLSGSFTANDLIDNGLFGNYYVNTGGTINLTNSDGYVDLNGNIFIYGGNFNVYGGTTASYWPYIANASITMTGGILDFKDQGIRFNTSGLGYTLTNAITGGTIRTAGYVQGYRTDFHPSAGTIEMYGNTAATIQNIDGFAFNNLNINKTVSSVSGLSKIDINRDFTITSGVFGAPDTMYVGGNWDNQVGISGFTEGTGLVIFDGSNLADIMSNESFYNMNVQKTALGSTALELLGNRTLNVTNNLNVMDGAFKLNGVTNLNIGKNLAITSSAGLNANSPNIAITIGGNWTNGNAAYSSDYGFDPGASSTCTFNGSLAQYLTTAASYEEFNNLIIDKSADKFRSNDNLHVTGNTSIQNGTWEDNVNGLIHVFSGNFTVPTTGALFNAATQNTIQFIGSNNSIITYLSLSGYFHNLVINKSGGAHVSQVGNTSCQFTGNLTIDHGTYDMNGYQLFVFGDVNINNTGILKMPAASQLILGDTRTLNVNGGGLLQIDGTSGNNAYIRSNIATAHYNFTVSSSATIAAKYCVFKNTGINGLNILSGATIDPTYALKSCTFTEGIVNGTLLTINNNQALTIDSANFPSNTWGGLSNASKLINQGHIYFTNYYGGFSGENYDADAFNKLDWVIPFTTTATAVPAAVCAGHFSQLNVTPLGGLSPYTYSWSPSSELSSLTISNPIATPAATTTYYVTITDGMGVSSAKSVVVTVNPNPTASAGTDVSIVSGTSTTLAGQAVGGTAPYVYLWTPAATLSDPAISNPLATPLATTTYVLHLTDANNCSNSDTVVVTLTPAGGGTIQGLVKYDNAAATPITTGVVRLMSGSTEISSTTTNASGFYSFGGVPAGSYTLNCNSAAAWGGANSADALLIQKHFTAIAFLTGLRVKAADVNNSGFINVTDALLVARRFTAIITSFPAGNWCFETFPVTSLGSGTIVQNLKGLCYGDVNASYPGPYKTPLFEMKTKDSMLASSGDIVEFPITLSQEAALGSVSLVVEIPGNSLEVIGITTNSEQDFALFNQTNDALRVSWYSTSDKIYTPEDVVFKIKVHLKGIPQTNDFSVLAESELSDHFGQAIFGIDLRYPELKSVPLNGDYFGLPSPNPFNRSSEIFFHLENPAHVSYKLYNISGQIVVQHDLGSLTTGSSSVIIDGNELAEGSYYCVFEVLRDGVISYKHMKLSVIR
ncbi:MAG: C10 family peptidase [Bacteroidota bacterium]